MRTRWLTVHTVLLLAGCLGAAAGSRNALAGEPPTARLTIEPTEGTAPLTILLEAGASSAADSTIIGYHWDFGDGMKSSSEQTVTHTYPDAGTFLVTLTVTDSEGQTAQDTETIFVNEATVKQPQPPAAPAVVLPKAVMPLIAPAGGTFTGQTKITLTTTTPGAHIRYTLDGTDPTNTSLLYRPSLILTSDATLRARAFLNSYAPSDAASAAFVIVWTPAGTVRTGRGAAPRLRVPLAAKPTIPVGTRLSKAAKPIIETPEGMDSPLLQIALRTLEADAQIRYTLNGAEPTESSALYRAALALSDATVIKARAFRAGAAPSDVATAVFKKAGQPAPNR